MKKSEIEMQQILKRLELIKTGISLEDEDIIELQITKLHAIDIDKNVQSILEYLSKFDYSNALIAIEDYISRNSGVSLYKDNQIQALKLELKVLEKTFEKLIDRKNLCTIEIDNFNHAYSLSLGYIIKAILYLKREIISLNIINKQEKVDLIKEEYFLLKQEAELLKNKIENIKSSLDHLDEFGDEYEKIYENYHFLKSELREKEDQITAKRKKVKEAQSEYKDDPINQAFEEAKADSQAFDEEYEEVLAKNIYPLDKDELKEIKVTYRKACKLCHPDIVPDNLKQQAHEMMSALNNAKNKNDLAKVKEILFHLESGSIFVSVSDTVVNKDILKAKVAEIKTKIEALKIEVINIESSDTYQTVINIVDLESYLDDIKESLELEKTRLESELQVLKNIPDVNSDRESDFFEDNYWQVEF